MILLLQSVANYKYLSFYVRYVAAGSISTVTVSVGSVTSSALTLTWMEINLTNSKLSHYTLFYLPLRGPYGPIMASDRRGKRQSTHPEELTMNFTGTTGTLTNLYGAVTYRIQVAAVSTFNGQYITGDRSPATEITTLEGSEQIRICTYIATSTACYYYSVQYSS